MRLKLDNKIYRSLTLINTMLLLAILLVGLAVVVLAKDMIFSRLGMFIEMEIAQSNFAHQINGRDQAALPLYDISIKPEYLRDIQLLVNKLLEQEVMTDEDKVWYPVQFYADGKEYQGKIRLRGDLAAHWGKPKKSWRIKFDQEHLFNGYRELNFVIPNDKAYEVEKVAYDAARKLGLLVPDSGFVQLRFNNVDMGTYFWYENNSKEMLEKLQYPEGEIFRENNTWVQTRFTGYGLYFSNDGQLNIPLYASNYTNSIHKDPSLGFYAERWNRLIALVRDGPQAAFERDISQLVDIEKYLRWNALTWLFGSLHSHWGDNLRWYYDNTRGLFEPIIYDVYRFPVDNLRMGTFEAKEYDPLAKKLLQIPAYQQRRNEILWDMLHDPEFDLAQQSDTLFKGIRSSLFTGVGALTPAVVDAFHKETVEILNVNKDLIQGHLEFSRIFMTPQLAVEDNKAVLKLKLLPDALVNINLKALRLQFQTAFDFDLNNLRISHYLNDVVSEVAVKNSSFNKVELLIEFAALAIATPRDQNLIPYPAESLLVIEFPDMPLSLWTSPGFLLNIDGDFYNSLNDTQVADLYTFQSPASYDFGLDTHQSWLSVDEFLLASNLPLKRSEQRLILEAGEYEIEKDLVFPSDFALELQAGVTLSLAPGISLVMYQPLIVSGSQDQPVTIRPLDEENAWGSIGIINASGRSKLDHFIVRGGSEDWVQGLYLSGQLNFYSSDVTLSHCSIEGAQADDGLNIKKAKFFIDQCQFSQNSSDAFDGDWVQGQITNSLFKDNGGDGIDFSGSQIIVSNSLFRNMADKAFSVGEKSVLYGLNNVIRDSVIGVASKDLSQVYIYASVFYGNQTAISAYQKKPVFGGGQAKVISSLFWNNESNFDPDTTSSIHLQGVGLNQWHPQAGVTGEDVRSGNIDDAYQYSEAADFQFLGTLNPDSPFAAGPEIDPVEVEGLSLPDLSKSPIGLIRAIFLEHD